MALTRGDLFAGKVVHLGLGRQAGTYEVDHPRPVNQAGEVTKGGRFVRLYKLDAAGKRNPYPIMRKASELVSHREWTECQYETDKAIVEKYGDRKLDRQVAAVRDFFAGMGMDDAVHVTRYTTLAGVEYVTKWGVATYHVDWPKFLTELGVIEADNDNEGDD